MNPVDQISTTILCIDVVVWMGANFDEFYYSAIEMMNNHSGVGKSSTAVPKLLPLHKNNLTEVAFGSRFSLLSN
jgi:hypothetical protein